MSVFLVIIEVYAQWSLMTSMTNKVFDSEEKARKYVEAISGTTQYSSQTYVREYEEVNSWSGEADKYTEYYTIVEMEVE